ncbi:alkaline phosphatase family protein [Brevibacillus sp. H7]|uniref:alkaline phosphatase family protein n=1 Tax=Brevibacillus sp. H7 TaxID=3349138 RepID=UPI00382EB0F0
MLRSKLGRLSLIAILLGTVFGSAWVQSGQLHWTEERIHTSGLAAKRKVILLLIDSMLSRSLEQLVMRNEAPALAFLMKNGLYRRDAISSFPTMSVTIDSTILTGTYADQHHVPGLLWFNQSEKRMVDYGDGMRIVWKPGLPQWFEDSFFHLNHLHLSKKTRTLHEELSAKGFTTGSINGLLYRGQQGHHFGIKGMYTVRLQGPDLLALGALSRVTDDYLPTSPFRSMGMNSDYTARSLISLIKENRLPDVTLAYFPDMDGDLHKYGPAFLEGLKKVEVQLQHILNAFGNWEDALRQHVFLLMGDSGVTATGTRRETALIDLEETLSGLRPYRLGEELQPTDDVAFAVNGRMCYVYSLSERAPLPAMIDRLKSDERIDLIAWQKDEWTHVRQGGRELRYRSGAERSDTFGKRWDVRGDFGVMNLKVRREDSRLVSDSHPDGLRRLQSALRSHAGRFLIATARPGAEFTADGAPNHPGGSNHGSLDASDSLVPLLIAPAGDVPSPPERLVDVKRYIMSLLEPK